MGVSDPEIRKKVFGPRWQHEIEKQGWPLWKRLLHRYNAARFAGPMSKLKIQRPNECNGLWLLKNLLRKKMLSKTLH